MAKITLRLIAEETGLSKFAVSRALAGKEGVSDATRIRVIETAERLGYRRPKDSDTLTVGAIFKGHDQFNGELHVQIQSGLQAEALVTGCNVRMHWSHGVHDLYQIIPYCDAFFVDNISDHASLALLKGTCKPMIRSGWVDPMEAVDTVSCSDREAGSAVAIYLLALGHKEIVYVHGDANLRGRRERLQGLREVIEITPEALFYDVAWDATTTFSSRIDEIIASGGRPTAFFCAHDGLALTAISDLLSRGWKIPEHASVIGFGDFSAARQIRPALTTIKVHGDRIGRSALRQLVAVCRTPDWPNYPIRIQIPNTLVERNSTGPAPTRAIAFGVLGL